MSYYHDNAKKYIDNTLNCDMSHLYDDFTKYLKDGDKVLDVGFGSGRDSLYFSKLFEVVSIDPEEKFCGFARNLGLKNVINMKAQAINFENEFNGIWACASLLHIPSSELRDVFSRCFKALKRGGIMYASFKVGDFEGIRNERYFTDLTLEKFEEIIKDIDFKIIKVTYTDDVRKDRNDKWLNVYIMKELKYLTFA